MPHDKPENKTMNDTQDNMNRTPEQDPQLTALHTRMKRELPLDAPAGLATDIFRATVSDLPERKVGRHLGWTSWAGWRYAAAIGLIFFYAALWAKPRMVEQSQPTMSIAAIESVVAPPSHTLDEDIDDVAAEVTAFAETLNPSEDFAWLEDDSDMVIREMIQLEDQINNTEMF